MLFLQNQQEQASPREYKTGKQQIQQPRPFRLNPE